MPQIGKIRIRWTVIFSLALAVFWFVNKGPGDVLIGDMTGQVEQKIGPSYSAEHYYAVDKTSLTIASLLLFLGLLVTTTAHAKYNTPKIVVSGLHSSTMARPVPAGNYELYTLGDVQAFNWYLHGREGTLILPIDAAEPLGESIIAKLHVKEVQFDELDEDVQRVINQHQRFRGPYYYGESDPENLTETIPYAELKKHFDEKELEDLGITNTSIITINRLINLLLEERRSKSQLRSLMKGDFKDLEDVMEHLERLKPQEKKNLFDKVKGD